MPEDLDGADLPESGLNYDALDDLRGWDIGTLEDHPLVYAVFDETFGGDPRAKVVFETSYLPHDIHSEFSVTEVFVARRPPRILATIFGKRTSQRLGFGRPVVGAEVVQHA